MLESLNMLQSLTHAAPARWTALLCCSLLALGVGCDFDSTGVADGCEGDGCARSATDATRRVKDANWSPTGAPNGTQTGAGEQVDAGGAPNQRTEATGQGGRKASKPSADDSDAGKITLGDAPQAEACNTRKEVCNTIDDDCDEKVDEDCECPGDKPVACYDGPAATRGIGSCHAGSRTCQDGVLGECTGAVMPTAETCNGKDDDCNGTVDDAPGLEADLKNCGRCGNACGEGESCCAGRCVNPRTGNDVEHCGKCGNKCTTGALPGCCGGGCVDLLTDTTCGTCDNACGIFKLGAGFGCTCKLRNEGPQCVARGETDEWMICK
jgi:hypothetical protein